MQAHYINRNSRWNEDHEVQKDGCPVVPKPANRTCVGPYPTSTSRSSPLGDSATK